MSLHSRGANLTSGTLRVAYVAKRFPRLSETFVLNEILELERQGVEVSVFSLRRPTDEPRHRLLSELRATVTYLPSNDAGEVPRVDVQQSARYAMGPTGDLLLGKSEDAVADLEAKARALAQAIEAQAITHIHAHFVSDTTIVASLASMLGDVPFSFTAHARDIYHTYVSPEIDAQVRRAKLKAAAFTITVSDYNRQHLMGVIGAADGAIHRLYNGIDLSRFAFSDFASREPRLILAVGRLVEKKGFSDLVAAVGHMHEQGQDIRCVIAGDGPLRADLEAQGRALGLENLLSFAGALPQDQVLHLMRHAAVLALPSIVTASGDRDGLPTVLLEALACGLPAVSTHVAGIPEIIADHETGVLVPPNDPLALAAALTRVLTDKPFARGLAQAGRRKAEQDFDLRKSAARLRQLFAEASGRTRASSKMLAFKDEPTRPNAAMAAATSS